MASSVGDTRETPSVRYERKTILYVPYAARFGFLRSLEAIFRDDEQIRTSLR